MTSRALIQGLPFCLETLERLRSRTLLHISLGTANKHIAHIYRKLGVDNKQELLVKLLGR